MRTWRGEQGLTQKAAGALLELDFVQVSKLERGVTLPGRTTAVRIEKATGIAAGAWDIDIERAAPAGA